MDRAIWAIMYDLTDDARDAYLRWFHDVHIPEKLSRPGYNWAGHYEIEKSTIRRGAVTLERQDSADTSPLAGKRYVALFCGESTATFYNPSPFQLKGQQDEETRRMIGCRVNPISFVLAEEWRACGKAGPGQTIAAAPVIEFELFDMQQGDEDIGVWCAQPRRSAFKQGDGCVVMQKLLASSGPARHGALQGYATFDSLTAHLKQLKDASENHRDKTGHEPPASSTVLATLISPKQ